MSKFLAASAGLALAAGALAGNTYGPGAGFAIPDNTPGGAGSSIVVTDSFSIQNVSVSIDMAHTWVGDLTATLSNGSTSFALFTRPGFTGTGFGNNTDLGGTYVFQDGAPSFTAATAANAGGFLIGGTYSPVGSLDAAFAGSNSAATWTLNVTDSAGGDLGSVSSWSLTLTPVPTPGAAALLGLAGVAGIRRRR